MEILTNFEVVALWNVLEEFLDYFPQDTFYYKYLVAQYKILGLRYLTHQLLSCIQDGEEAEKFIDIRRKDIEELHKASLDQQKIYCKQEEESLQDSLQLFYSKIDQEVIASQLIRRFLKKMHQDSSNKLTRLKERQENVSKILGKCSNYEEVLSSIHLEANEFVDVGMENNDKIFELSDELEALKARKISDFFIEKSKIALYLHFLIARKKKVSKEEILTALKKSLNQKKKGEKGKKGKKTVGKKRQKKGKTMKKSVQKRKIK